MMAFAKGAEPISNEGGESVGQAEQARAVQAMFNNIAPRYDLLNHVLSANIDRLWWRRSARTFRPILAQPQATIVDVCCGTGDMTLALLRLRPLGGQPVLALDFARAMLDKAEKKFASSERSSRKAIVLQGDALRMPLADGSVDLLTTAFGFRNLASYEDGLREFHRVLRPGGELGILDFSEPDGAVGAAYRFYFHTVLPRLGKLISGSAESYEYLPRSVSRFPAPPAMLSMLRTCGFDQATWTPYTFGIAGLYRAVKA